MWARLRACQSTLLCCYSRGLAKVAAEDEVRAFESLLPDNLAALASQQAVCIKGKADM